MTLLVAILTQPFILILNIAYTSGENCLLDEPLKFLDQILRLRSCFTALKFEVLHSSWEKVMR